MCAERLSAFTVVALKKKNKMFKRIQHPHIYPQQAAVSFACQRFSAILILTA